MNVFDFPFALFAFLGFVAVVPAWVWFVTQHSGAAALQLEAQFLVALALPATAGLFLAGWLQPGGG